MANTHTCTHTLQTQMYPHTLQTYIHTQTSNNYQHNKKNKIMKQGSCRNFMSSIFDKINCTLQILLGQNSIHWNSFHCKLD